MKSRVVKRKSNCAVKPAMPDIYMRLLRALRATVTGGRVIAMLCATGSVRAGIVGLLRGDEAG